MESSINPLENIALTVEKKSSKKKSNLSYSFSIIVSQKAKLKDQAKMLGLFFLFIAVPFLGDSGFVF